MLQNYSIPFTWFSHERTHFRDDESDDGGNHLGAGHHKTSSRPCRPYYNQNLTFNDGPQGVTRAVIVNFDVCTTSSFQQTYDRNFATCASSKFAAYSLRSVIAFIDLNFPCEGLTLLQVQQDDSSTKSSIKLMRRVFVNPYQLTQ